MTPGQNRIWSSPLESTRIPPLNIAYVVSGLHVHKSACSNPMAWRIERIFCSAKDLCRGHIANKRCTSRITKYNWLTTMPPFTGIQQKTTSRETKQKQFWFCPTNINCCISGQSRWIVYYSDIPSTWRVKTGTNLSQAEVEAFEAAGFEIDDGDKALEQFVSRWVSRFSSVNDAKVEAHPPKSSGDVHLTSRNGQSFRFVLEPSPEHYAKMEKAKSIECIVLRYVKVPSLGYGIVYSVHTPTSVAKQQLYKVPIDEFPACTCIDFVLMKAIALGNGRKKWICYKHLYFILQRFIGCTAEDKFPHCSAWTFNEVKLLLDKADEISSAD
jgi:hypothetical protein